MDVRTTFVGKPLDPGELERLARIYNVARWMTGRSRHDPSAARLAAMAIRFYQLGVRDDDVLLEKVLSTHSALTSN
ncbi:MULTISPECIES: hypothetical protein [Rhizobium/Agrobacterium group]|jgi:hypothetical protein|uniref:Uncharacterized protein n=1 Tax=Rhizobium soli TaxID=424798 RepID=A0A7X0JM09_9HYPH|nr:MULTISPECIES: hypothetical protein [Rhizobium/Agrobacterium group]RYE68261.1 MAG: hypothetical protein EOP17_06630 [Rhizobiaceae bacterium]KQQ37744.1 hypothetical protein ASG19_01135 [Rhizobium sp. Leaf306]KQQ74177.1 hypothetical protein ASF70_10600 [Rhizobium sp. Leaf321]MBB6509187.1 hypothetical protein [Rhizobium soli]MBD8649927.1 hypothetical protein [Rhizobium sp. CFBP 13726]